MNITMNMIIKSSIWPLFKQNIALLLHWRMDLPDQLLYIELFSALFKDLSLFYANKLEVNGISGFHQDKLNLFQSEKRLNNFLNKFIILFYWATIALVLTIQEINLLKKSETPKSKDTTLLESLVLNNARNKRLT